VETSHTCPLSECFLLCYHCDIAEWAFVTLGVKKPSQWEQGTSWQSLSLVQQPRFLHALVVHPFLTTLFHTQFTKCTCPLLVSKMWSCHYVGQSQKRSSYLHKCEFNPAESNSLFFAWYFVLFGNFCRQSKVTGGCKVSASYCRSTCKVLCLHLGWLYHARYLKLKVWLFLWRFSFNNKPENSSKNYLPDKGCFIVIV